MNLKIAQPVFLKTLDKADAVHIITPRCPITGNIQNERLLRKRRFKTAPFLTFSGLAHGQIVDKSTGIFHLKFER
jgi:hypothetical protein